MAQGTVDISSAELLVERVARLKAAVGRLCHLPAAAEMTVRLDRALQYLQAETVPAVVQAVLLGPTGAGKSTLFNSLIRRPGASPVSDAERCFTKTPYVAVSQACRPLVAVPEELRPQFVESPLLGRLVLCDLPDIDGVLAEHWDIARQIVEQSHIVVYVTSPEKRADFRVHEEVRRWAERKRWLFVLNRADEIPEGALEEVCRDWDRRLKELGFDPDERNRFVVSAKHPQRFQFDLLRRELIEHDYRQDLRQLRDEVFLAHVQYATSPTVLAPLQDKIAQLRQAEERFADEIRRVYQRGFQEPRVAAAFRAIVRQQVWQSLARRLWGIASLTAWVHARWHYLMAGYRLLRLGVYGPSLWGIARATMAALRAFVTGIWPLKEVLEKLGSDTKWRLKQLAADIHRTLEDHQLAEVLTSQGPDTAEPPSSSPATTLKTSLEQIVVGLLNEETDQELLLELRNEVDEQAEELASRVAKWWVNVAANLLPTAVLVDIAVRLGWAWVGSAWYLNLSRANYPPAGFYWLAMALLVLSVLPGHWLVSVRTNGQINRLRPSEDIRIANSALLRPLQEVRGLLNDVVTQARALHQQACQLRQALAHLPGTVVGRSGDDETSPIDT